MRKFTKGITKKLSKSFKFSRNRIPAVQNVDPQGAVSSQKVESFIFYEAPRTRHIRILPPTSIPPLLKIQGSSREPASKVLDTPFSVEETPGPQSVDAELRNAHEDLERIKTLGGPATSMASAIADSPADLAAADDFQTTYLQPLKIFNTVIENIANVWAALLD
ncbi:hypothetical protein DFJ58DRAFT_845398 [Suillus subalutaceus]|uniref:uncharacterized protein n=1 Tax=Suillus subalutaceus TaxID=48586 RepID=UPI001B880A86|nr:uncharacterized protein DFJ58DRAFT_845398 [Suillus subalutaceus]KAG1840267.1 hypothetical protein DFJ58DRAFT_845398 [Suillus subalutaceus]